MPQMIQCPTCSKKFKLPDRPPATFTCTGCQTVMDLSGFRAAAPAEAAAPAAPAPSTKTTSSTRSASRASSGSAGSTKSRSGSSSKSRARAGRDEEEAGEGTGRRGPPPKNNNGLIIGSLFGVVVLGGILLLAMRSKEPPAAPSKPVAVAPDADPVSGMGGPAMATGEPAMEEVAAPAAPAYVAPAKVQFHPIEHHADAKPDERTKIDELIQKAVFENSGSDGRLAEDELVKFGVKAAPRIINVFSTVKMGAGFDDRLGKIQASVADRILRRIDGYIERSVSAKMTPIKPQSDHGWVEKVARNWIAWWDNEKYKTPQKPWDERIDGAAIEAAGMDDPAGMKADGGADGK
jgi:hypothetical protein